VSHKSLLKNITVTQAGRAHSCTHDKTRRFTKGDYRLTIKEDRDESHYPLDFAQTLIRENIKRLEVLLERVSMLQQSVSPGKTGGSGVTPAATEGHTK